MTQTLMQTSKNYARLLLATAMEFYQTYVVIEEDKPPKHDFISMKHYLLCHALELTLKGWLVDTGGYNEEKLKEKFRHDLEKLANEVKQVYGPFQELDACLGFINVLNPDYKNKGYEYPINNGLFVGTEYEKFGTAISALMAALIRSILSYHYPDKPLP